MKPFDLESAARDLGLKITLDPTARIETSRAEKRWLTRIPTSNGSISVHSSDQLTAYCVLAKPAKTIAKLQQVPGRKAFKMGTGEFALTFDAEHLHLVAEILGAKKRHHATEDAVKRIITLNHARKVSRQTQHVAI